MKEEGFTVKKLVDATGIAVKHIESLLESDFKELPPAPYLRGYIYTLGAVLNFDAEPWWQIIKEGMLIKKSGTKDSLPNNRFAQKDQGKKIVIVIAVIAVVSILIWRLPKIFGNPELLVTTPSQTEIIVSSETYIIKGKVESNNDTVTINNEAVATDKDGFWQKTVLLQFGINTFEIKAKKLLGSETIITKQIVYETPITPNSTSTVKSSSTNQTIPATSSVKIDSKTR
jgi:cytoskeletal protein RodZ